MPSEVTNYQCPACGGPLHYDEKEGKLKCDYCGSSYTPEEIESYYAQKNAKAASAAENNQPDQKKQTAAETAKRDGAEKKGQSWDTSDLSDDWGGDAKGMRVYTCPSCGAELILDETTGASSCPYCGNPTIIPGQFSGILKPDYVLPFEIGHDDAVNALKKFYKGKPLLPRAFTNENHIQEVKGVYVPFWLFDGRAEGEVQFHAENIRNYVAGDYDVTETDHFEVTRAGNMEFKKIPVDASSKMPDDYMDALEPFDYSALKPFSLSYLPGFLANKYDVSVKECAKHADERCANSFVEECGRTVTGYSMKQRTGQNIRIHRGKVHYGLLPVWILHTRWNNKNFLFAVNGQNGKVAGELPVNHKRAVGYFAAIAAPIMAVGTAIVLALVH